jgi:hypothetical protein
MMSGNAAYVLLFAEGDAIRQQSGAKRASLRTNNLGRLSHLLPNPNCRRMHIEQSHLLAALSSKTVDADCRQGSRLSRSGQVRSHTYGRCILNVPHILRCLRNDLIVQRRGGVFRHKVTQKIVRRGARIVLQNAQSAPRKENQ